ncbi:MAG: ester cyclase [Dehalococcoidia bacterium]|nr:MAG: ester cyclase [Dehalococcoidia bacterium]
MYSNTWFFLKFIILYASLGYNRSKASFYGIKGIGNWLGEQWKAYPDLKVKINHIIACGDIVVVRWTTYGVSKGKFLMLPPTNTPVEYTGLSLYRIEDGKIIEIWETRNTLGIMNHLNPEMSSNHHH